MKVYVFILPLALLMVACSSPEIKAKKAIKESLRLTLNDFKSYEPVQYGKLEVDSSKYTDIPEVTLYNSKFDAFMKVSQEDSDKSDIYITASTIDVAESYLKLSKQFLDSADVYIKKVDSIKLHFVSKPIGWKITHTFRAKNLMGGLGLNTYLFTINQELTKVIKSENLSTE
jgi:hypothetical protein